MVPDWRVSLTPSPAPDPRSRQCLAGRLAPSFFPLASDTANLTRGRPLGTRKSYGGAVGAAADA